MVTIYTYILFSTLLFNDGSVRSYTPMAGLTKEQCIYFASKDWQDFYNRGQDKYAKLDEFCQSKESGRIIDFFHYKCDKNLMCVVDINQSAEN